MAAMPGIDDNSIEVSRRSQAAWGAEGLRGLAAREKEGRHRAKDDAEKRRDACVFADFFHENLPTLPKHSEDAGQ